MNRRRSKWPNIIIILLIITLSILDVTIGHSFSIPYGKSLTNHRQIRQGSCSDDCTWTPCVRSNWNRSSHGCGTRHTWCGNPMSCEDAGWQYMCCAATRNQLVLSTSKRISMMAFERLMDVMDMDLISNSLDDDDVHDRMGRHT